MTDKIVTIAEYVDSMKAEMAKQLLEDFGIKAVVVDQNAANLTYLPSQTAKLQVLESDAAKAAEILESKEPSYTQEELEDLDDLDELGGPKEQEGL
jgi:hypothetical protein